ncbi:MAG TPA: DUF1552 domain-containing protein [Vicinamibacterales bacterium]|jgi:hypothetical protein|nr:DUF1552 domain-containing protein [Vicinamibacterales bacterium]
MSFITKKHLPRRTFLKGAGITLALPLLESMIPASTAFAQTVAAQRPTRFMGIFFPHGMAPGYWEPKGATLDTLPFIMEPLRNVKDQTVIIKGLWSKSAEPPEGTTGSDHWVAAAYLTGIKPKKTAGSDANVGSATVDQQIATKIGQESLLPSLQLACEDPNSSSSNCGEGYSCSYTNSISWIELPPETGPGATPGVRTSPLPMELNPQVVFERLFGSGATPEVRAARMKQSRSILDSVTKELASLRRDLPPADIQTLNQYTEEIAEIERRIQLAGKASGNVPEMDLPPGIPEQFDEHIKLHAKLVTLAFKADITRVATLLGARDLTSRAYPFPKGEWFPDGGTSVSFHGGSHHQDDPVQIKRYSLLNRYHVSTLAYLAEQLKATPDGDGTLLDHSLIAYGTNMGNSNQHQHYDVPHILIGGASGQLKGGRSLEFERKTVTTGNLLVSLLSMYGIDKKQQGDSTGPLAGLV